MKRSHSEDSEDESTTTSSLEPRPETPPRSFLGRSSTRNLTKGLVNALTSPVKVAVNSPLSGPALRLGKGLKKRISKSLQAGACSEHERATWQEELNLPPGTTKEEAVAILLCRELGDMDII